MRQQYLRTTGHNSRLHVTDRLAGASRDRIVFGESGDTDGVRIIIDPVGENFSIFEFPPAKSVIRFHRTTALPAVPIWNLTNLPAWVIWAWAVEMGWDARSGLGYGLSWDDGAGGCWVVGARSTVAGSANGAFPMDEVLDGIRDGGRSLGRGYGLGNLAACGDTGAVRDSGFFRMAGAGASDEFPDGEIWRSEVKLLESRRTKIVGAFLLWGLVCFAIGNGHATTMALQGSANWWQGHETKALRTHAAVDQRRERDEAAQCRLAIMNAQ